MELKKFTSHLQGLEQKDYQQFLTKKIALSQITHKKIVQIIHNRYISLIKNEFVLDLNQEDNIEDLPQQIKIASDQMKSIMYPLKLNINFGCNDERSEQNYNLKQCYVNMLEFFKLPQLKEISIDIFCTERYNNLLEILEKGLIKYARNVEKLKFQSVGYPDFNAYWLTEFLGKYENKSKLNSLGFNYEWRSLHGKKNLNQEQLLEIIQKFENLEHLDYSLECGFFEIKEIDQFIDTLKSLKKLKKINLSFINGMFGFQDGELYDHLFEKLQQFQNIEEFEQQVYYGLRQDNGSVLGKFLNEMNNMKSFKFDINSAQGDYSQQILTVFQNFQRINELKNLRIKLYDQKWVDLQGDKYGQFLECICKGKKLESFHFVDGKILNDQNRFEQFLECVRQLDNLQRITVDMNLLKKNVLENNYLQKFVDVLQKGNKELRSVELKVNCEGFDEEEFKLKNKDKQFAIFFNKSQQRPIEEEQKEDDYNNNQQDDYNGNQQAQIDSDAMDLEESW